MTKPLQMSTFPAVAPSKFGVRLAVSSTVRDVGPLTDSEETDVYRPVSCRLCKRSLHVIRLHRVTLDDERLAGIYVRLHGFILVESVGTAKLEVDGFSVRCPTEYQ